MPSLRRCAEVGRPFFAAAGAILAVISCPVSVSPSNRIWQHRNLGASGAHHVNGAGIHFPEKKWILRPKSHRRITIGTVYVMLGKMVSGVRVEGLETTALTLYTLSLIAIFLTGYVGYCGVEWFWPGFYYSPIKDGKNVWLFMQLACMVVYTAGVLLAFNRIGRTSQRWRDQH